MSGRGLKRGSIVLLLVLFIINTVAASDIGLYSLKLNNEKYGAGDTVQITADIYSNSAEPLMQNRVVFALEKSNRAVMQISSLNFDLAPSEVKRISESLVLPSYLAPGDYKLVARLYNAADKLAGALIEELEISNPGSFKEVELSAVTFSYGGLEDYGQSGLLNVPENEPFNVNFALKNVGSSALDNIEAELKFVKTFDKLDVAKTINQVVNLNKNEQKELSFDVALPAPGGYTLYVAVKHNGELLAMSENRVTVSGFSGSIQHVKNLKDIYNKNDLVRVTASVVGSADSTTIINDAQLDLAIYKKNNLVYSEIKTISVLMPEGKEIMFEFTAPEELDDYVLRLDLKKDSRLLDTFIAAYYELPSPECIFVFGKLKCDDACFDDNVCERFEYYLGNCFDCKDVQEPPESFDPDSDDDRDGLTRQEELALGTNPNNKDTDGDGATDKEEFEAQSDPLDKSSRPLKIAFKQQEAVLDFIILLVLASVLIYIIYKVKPLERKKKKKK